MIPVLPEDKANHFVYGSLVAFIGLFFDPLPAAAMVLLVGFGKELYDLVSGRGTPDGTDALATVAGGAVVVAPALLRSL